MRSYFNRFVSRAFSNGKGVRFSLIYLPSGRIDVSISAVGRSGEVTFKDVTHDDIRCIEAEFDASLLFPFAHVELRGHNG